MAGIGRFDLTDKDTATFNYFFDSPGSAGIETAAMGDSGNGTIPRVKAYTALTFNRGGWQAVLANTYITGVTDDDDGESIKYYTGWDGSIGYTFSQSDWGGEYLKGLKLTVGCNDLFNRQPSNDYDIVLRERCRHLDLQPDCALRLRLGQAEVLMLPGGEGAPH